MRNENSRTTIGLAFVALGFAAFVVAGPGLAQGQSGRAAWDKVSSWAIQTGEMPDNVQSYIDSPVDLAVLGPRNKNGVFWTKDDLNQIKRNKMVIAYLSVGEADPGEPYYKKSWTQGNPKWLAVGNPFGHDGFGVYPVNTPEWIRYLKQSMDRLIKTGYDGAFYDVLDVYWNPGYPGGPSAQNMKDAIALGCELTNYARKKNPNFKILVNNASNLMNDFPDLNFGNCFDATVMESLFYSSTDHEQSPIWFNYHIPLLKKQMTAGKKIFVLDKALIPANKARGLSESKKLGFIYFASDYAVSQAFPTTLP